MHNSSKYLGLRVAVLVLIKIEWKQLNRLTCL